MLVGAPLSGKTTVWRILADALNRRAHRERSENLRADVAAGEIRIQVIFSGSF